MDAFITALVGGSGLTASTFWGQVQSTLPWLVIIVPFAFGYGIVKKLIKGGSKAKVKL